MTKKKTSAVIAETTSIELGGQTQSINQYRMLGSVYSPGLVDEMLAQSPTVQLGWLGLSAAMAQAQVALQPCGCKQEIFDFIDNMLFRRLETRFQQVFLTTLDALLYGVAPAEISLTWEYGHWIISDISSRPVRGFNLYSVTKESKNFWIHGQYQWFDRSGALKTVECGAPDEPDKALIWWPVFGGGILGKSLLRPIVDEHLNKNLIRKLRGNAISKSIFGVPVLHARTRGSEEDPLSVDEVKAAQMAVAKAATGNASCLYLSDAFDVPTTMYASTDGVAKSIEAENALDIQILMSLGSSHLARGLLSGYGSQGAEQGDMQLQDSIRQYYFSWFAEQFQQLIDYIVDINFGPQTRYPELSIVSPSMMTVPQLSRVLAQLSAAGLYRPCTADEDILRQLCRMPEQNGKLIKKPEDSTARGTDELGIKGHYDEELGLDTREGRDVLYEENKVEI